MDLLIVGAGEMGRWFGATVAAHADGDVDLAFADVDPDAARGAAEAVGGRAVDLDADPANPDDPRDGPAHDAVCVAVPMSAAADAIAAHAGRADRAVVDVTGSMEPAVAAMREHAPDLERLSLHPLFSSRNAPGRVAAVPDREGPATDRIRRALAAAGNEVVETTPSEHDRAMETVQARAHAAVLAFALAADPVPPGLATPVFESLADVVDTVTGNDPGVYAEIQAAFDGADDVARAARDLADADPDGFAALYREAGVPLDATGEVDADPGETTDVDDGETTDVDDGETTDGDPRETTDGDAQGATDADPGGDPDD